jgi:hypothetical protein
MKNTRAGFIFVISVGAVAVVLVVLVAGIMSRKYGSGDLRMKLYALKKEKAKGKGPEQAAPPASEPPKVEAPAGGGTPPPPGAPPAP